MNNHTAAPARAVALRPAIVLATMLGISMSPATARPPVFKSGAPVVQLAQQGDIGPGAASAAAGAASGGRVLGVRRVRSASGVIYKVKVLLPGGRMRTVTVNGRTGQVRG